MKSITKFFYRKPGEPDGEILKTGAIDIFSTTTGDESRVETQTSALFEKYDPLLHGPLKSKKIFTVQFMKKYIHLCKQFNPVLGDEAAKMIADEYAKLRSEDQKEADVARVSLIFLILDISRGDQIFLVMPEKYIEFFVQQNRTKVHFNVL